MIDPISLAQLSEELLADAGGSRARRSARTVVGGHDHIMRQTLIALLVDSSLAEHDSPGEATLHVIKGRLSLEWDMGNVQGRTGDLIEIPRERHSLHAIEDSVVLLTAVPREHVAAETD
ncbi:LuxR family transcriptional regulator [Ammonicoccus fulvus]|uniref:LuxR family transcriptional regulator n=1 Tax=Ammonicoccus fulvus TaxID=3138240 RepID=A0ABZ3FLE7_9ACTN